MNCEICSGQPAESILLQSASSRIIWWNHGKVNSTLCGDCAENIYYHQQRRTLIQGWWGPLSALATVWFTIANFLRITKHRSLVPTVEVNGVQAMRPRYKVSRNPAVMIVSVVAIFIILAIATSIATEPTPVSVSDPTSYSSTCWEDRGNDQLRQVSCESDSADYESYQLVADPSLCIDTYLEAGDQYACLRQKY